VTLALVGHLLGVAAASGTRASLTLLALAVATRLGELGLPSELSFLSRDPGLVLLVVLVVLDEMVERDPDLQSALMLANVGIRGAAGALAAWGVHDVAPEGVPEPVLWGVGAAVAIGVHLLRARIGAVVPAGHGLLDPRAWLGWLEAGGVVGLIVAVLLAPVLALLFVGLATLGSLALVALGRAVERARHRRRCPTCGAWARVEASRCPACRGPLPVVRWLGAAGLSPPARPR
jgi:hypothetical protein